MEKTVMDIRKALIEMPLNSITYLEIPEEDRATGWSWTASS